MKIKILSDELINKIAAGEVLERPSSAVKELVENSIDANSKTINIYVRNGGKTEITVIDDGDGIDENQLELAVKRHATSKLNMENFDNILSLGFRGEALPSIAAVSNLKIKSNTKNNENGNSIELNAGKIISMKPTNQKKGTFINVKDLFFSTPARLKFLKSENYESLLIKRTIKKLAICNYNIIFNLNVNHKDVLKTKKVEETDDLARLKIRVAEVLGNEFIENSIFFDEQKDCCRFFGFLGVPTYHHSNTNNQYIFVNKRIVQDKSLNIIFKLAYRDFISYDRFPQFVCFIECPSEDIDVNVHPAKNEVRFKDIKSLNSNIINCVKENLKKVMHFASTVNTDRAINKFSKSVLQNTLKLAETPDVDFTPVLMKGENQRQNEGHIKKEFPLGYAKSQFHNTYIISQTDNGIVVVDQHAAHERIVYERLKNQIYKNEIKTQLLLIPVVIDIEKSSLNVILNSLDTVKKFGVIIEPFGSDSIVVREVPGILSDCDIKNLTLDIIDDLIESKDSKLVEERINRICSKMACHGSIRAGREMQINEMNDLLRRMEATPFSGQCNHGRPTYVELKLNDIEKLFGRR
jgi:DNA mismatch repair protein MutL